MMDLFDAANMKVGAYIGIDCFTELCSAVNAARIEANDSVSNADTFLDFLAAEWVAVVDNRYFKRMYSKMIEYYYWCSYANVEITRDGGIIHFRGRSISSTIDATIDDKVARQKADKAFAQVLYQKALFDSQFWDDAKADYSCTATPACDTGCEIPATTTRIRFCGV